MTRNKVTGSTRALRLIGLMAAIALLIGMLPLCAVATGNTSAASVGDTQYATVAEAVEHANGSYVKLLADSQESITVGADLYLDLNGHTLAAVTVSSGTLYGMDSTTDDYDCTDGYGKILSVTGSYARQHKSDVPGSIRRYLAVEEDGAVSFHRLYLGITQSSIAPASYGVGYKAVFAVRLRTVSIPASRRNISFTCLGSVIHLCPTAVITIWSMMC